MFVKLMKYEMMSTARVFGVCYLALLAVSLLLLIPFHGALINGFDTDFYAGRAGGMFTATLMMIYIGLIVAVCAVTLIFIIKRFHVNLLGSEGYLMMTLPVPTWELVLSKVVAALIWTFLSAVAIVVSMLIIGIGSVGLNELGQMFAHIPDVLGEFYKITGHHVSAYVFPVILMCIFGVVASVLQIYFAMMVGWQANKHKVLLSVIAFFVICAVISFVTTGIGGGFEALIGAPNGEMGGADYYSMTWLWKSIAEDAALTVVFFLGTTLLMKNRLNLE